MGKNWYWEAGDESGGPFVEHQDCLDALTRWLTRLAKNTERAEHGFIFEGETPRLRSLFEDADGPVFDDMLDGLFQLAQDLSGVRRRDAFKPVTKAQKRNINHIMGPAIDAIQDQCGITPRWVSNRSKQVRIEVPAPPRKVPVQKPERRKRSLV